MTSVIAARAQMPDVTLTSLVSAALPLVATLLPVWPAMKAKKLGQFQYRWGMYVAAEALVASIYFSVDALRSLSARAPWETGAFLVMSVLAIVASGGVFHRQRWGVIALIVVSVLSLTFPSVYFLLGGRLRGKITGEGLLVAIFLVINARYFRRRLGRHGSAP